MKATTPRPETERLLCSLLPPQCDPAQDGPGSASADEHCWLHCEADTERRFRAQDLKMLSRRQPSLWAQPPATPGLTVRSARSVRPSDEALRRGARHTRGVSNGGTETAKPRHLNLTHTRMASPRSYTALTASAPLGGCAGRLGSVKTGRVPSSVVDLLACADLDVAGTVRWAWAVPCPAPGSHPSAWTQPDLNCQRRTDGPGHA